MAAVKPPKRKTAIEALVTGAAAIGTLILLNVLSCQSRAKLDLTEYKVYSLTPSSRGVVANMPEKVNIKAYFGNVPPDQQEKQTYVDMLLQEYAEASGGKINYERLDPWKDKALAEEIQKDGIKEIRLQSLKEDSYELVPMYFQIVFQHLDKKEVWTPDNTFSLEGLEWDFTTRIKRMAYGKKKVGITTGFGEPPGAQLLLQGEQYGWGQLALSDIYEPSTVNWAQEPQKIDALDVLIVNGPTEKVSDAALYRLDQFVMKGKPVLFFVSGMKWQGAGQQQMQMAEGPQPYVGMPSESGVAPLLKTYGFEVGQNVIIDNQNFDHFAPPGSPRGYLYKYLAPIAHSQQTGTAQILQGIEGVLVPLASTLKLVGPLEKPGDDTTVIQLLRTQDTSWARKDVIAISPQLQLVAPVGGEHGPYLVAAAVKGRFKSYFDGKPVPAGADQPATPSPTPGLDQGEADEPVKPAAPAAPAPAGAESPSNTRIVVVTSPAMVADSLPTRNYINGFKAAHAMVDWLAEDQDLSAARAKTIARPINRLEPATRDIVKVANIVGGPLLLIVFGLVYWRVRESRRRDIKL
jgi:ABC-type uncharacterized transport system involved in gliding motility auxiliary subunit